MSVLYFAIIGIIVALLCYFVMGRWVERNMAKPVAGAETPACKLNDGANYRPQNKWILLGYHWAAICGPAPIIGGILVLAFGWLPALIWFSLGFFFIGGMHDYMSNMLSVRNGAASIASLAGRLLTGPAKVMFSILSWFVCILVVGAFSIIFGHVLVSMPEQAPIAVYFTIIAYLVGLLMYRTKIPLGWTVLIGCIAYGFAVWLGILWPWKGPFGLWFWVIVAYAFVVSIIPVAHIETPRGALNAVLMAIGVLVVFIGVFALGIATPEAAAVKLPAWGGSFFKIPGAGPLWPMVPVVATCGAIAGFHALASSTVTAHQLNNECDAMPVVWGSMSLEYLVAIWAVMAACTLAPAVYKELVGKSPLLVYGKGSANLVAVFGLSPRVVATGFMCILVAFMTTSLDTITRIGRFMLNEIGTVTSPGPKKALSNRLICTILTCGVGALLGWTGTVWSLWPLLGGALQSLAVLVLALITANMLIENKPYIYPVITFSFLGVTVALAALWMVYFHATVGHWITSVIAAIILICEVGFMILFLQRWSLYKESNSIEEFEAKIAQRRLGRKQPEPELAH